MREETIIRERVQLEKHAAWLLGVPTALVFAAFFVAQVYMKVAGPDDGLVAAFGLDGEHNVPAFWNMVLLLSIGAVALAISVLTPAGRRPSPTVWRLAALAMAYLAMDEALSLHEKLGGPADALIARLGIDVPTYTWVLPGLVLAVIGAVVAVRWFAALPRDVRLGVMAGGATYVFGALVVETLNGALFTAGFSTLYTLSTAVEELLEMAGCVITACVLLRLVDVDPVTRAAQLRPEAAPHSVEVRSGRVRQTVEHALRRGE